MHCIDLEVRFLPVYIEIAIRNYDLPTLREDHM